MLLLVVVSDGSVQRNPRSLNTRQVLVQYTSPQEATLAMDALNSETVYVGSDPVIGLATSIQYSNLQDLSIKQQGPDARCVLLHCSYVLICY
jgi:hypothetical protein